MNKDRKARSIVFEYTFAGALFGLVFPSIASIIEINHGGLVLTFSNLLLVQVNNPLLWIIDSAIIILGLAGYIAGDRQQKLVIQTRQLEAAVEERSQDVIRQKLFYEALVENSPLAVATLDKEHRIISINPAFTEMFGYRQEEIMGKELDSIIANPDRPSEAVNITTDVLGGKGIHEIGKRLKKNGDLVDVEIFGEPIFINKNLIGVLGLYRNISSEKKAQEELVASEERFRRMFTDSPIALRMEDLSKIQQWAIDKGKSVGEDLSDYLKQHPEEVVKALKLAKIIDLNDASLVLYHAKDKAELQGNLHAILSLESYPAAIEIFCAMLRGVTSFECEMVYQPLIGGKIYTITKLSVIPGHEHDWSRVLFSNMDITDRKMAEERLKYISLHDLMTAVYNRAYFEEEMARLEKSRLHPISILVMDMDNLKIINDQYGHQTGDIALQTIADILRTRFRSEDVVARIGGDEFAVLLPGVNPEMSLKMKERILEGVAAYNRQKGITFGLSLSIGCATVEKGGSMDVGFKLADERMYEQKQLKKNK